MYCSNCGSQLKETDIFCSKCGHKQVTDNKPKEPQKEEVVFNSSPEKEKPIPIEEQRNQYSNYERESQPTFRAPSQAHQSVNNARRPVEDDFVWNVHDFPETGPREAEDSNFRWDEEIQPRSQRFTRPTNPQREEFEDDSKFHTYNKNREEFQELLDKEYVRQNREFQAPVQRGPQDYPPFDPRDHINTRESQREQAPEYYNDRDNYQEDNQRFDTHEFQNDLRQPDMYQGSNTQVIEKINYGEEAFRNQEDNFDIKKTQYIEDEYSDFPPVTNARAGAPTIPPVGGRGLGEDYINPNLGMAPEFANPGDYPPRTETVENLPSSQEPVSTKEEGPVVPVGANPSQTYSEGPESHESHESPGAPKAYESPKAHESPGAPEAYESPKAPESLGAPKAHDSAESPGRIDESLVEKTPSPDVDERLSKLWDSDTAPVPVASLGSQARESEKDLAEDSEGDASTYDPLDDIYDDYEASDGKRGGFFGKFIIAIIIVVLIIEGSILGLRNFAPESDATAKANQVILVLQTWIEDTFFDKK